MRSRFLLPGLLLVSLVAGCGGDPGLKLTSSTDWHAYVQDRRGGRAGADLDTYRFKANLCDETELKIDYTKLDENDVVRFLERQHIDTRLERPRADLIYALLSNVGTQKPIRLRIAILPTADEAGRELHEAILQHGPGSWGVHRSNLAVLGPIGSPEDDLAFAAATKLACWGVFTIGGTDDTFVVPGAYTEL